LEPEKLTELALRAWHECRARRYGWRLLIAGRGEQEALLRTIADQLGIADSVDFLGFRSDIQNLFERASILLAPAPAEPLGLSVIEAMAAGLPIVASASGGHLETVGAVERSSLFEPNDHAEAASRLDRLAFDVDERERYGAALRGFQQAYLDIGRQVDQIASLYRLIGDLGRWGRPATKIIRSR
jgi:glycosyltransferase involved in cell wall biosynthesis